ncbi:MAG: hypothetical protein AB7O52_02155 [Planctomycetota bacterium]
MKSRPNRIGWTLVGLCLLSGCVSPIDGGRGLAPFFEVYPTDSPADTRWVLRPVVAYERTAARSDLTVLWPLYRDTHEGAYRKQWLLPLWYNSVHPNPDGTKDWDSFILPLFFYGSDPAEGGYFLAFPIGGVIKGAFGQDSMTFALFPLYARIKDGTRTSNHWLWPVANHVHGPYHSGFRLWPFYGRYRATTQPSPGERAAPPQPKYDRRFYAWPFLHFQENNLDAERPLTTRWWFPFYGRTKSSNLSRTSILWPLYQYETNDRKDSVSHSSFVLGWNWTRSPDLSRTDFGPLFGVRRTADRFRQFVLFPIERYERWSDGSRRGLDFWLLPFYRQHIRQDLREGTYESHTRLWPLFSHQRDADGSVRVNALELLPWDDPKRLDHLYSRFWRIYRYAGRGAQQGHAWEVLWGVVRREVTPERRWLSILGGVYESTRSPAGRTHKILFVPLPF